MTHQHLCERAAAWLRSRRCDPVLTGVASADEIPDAVGWNGEGSVVVECKASRSDFLRDSKKYVRLRHPDGWSYRLAHITKQRAIEMGCIEERIPNMGDTRYFLCPAEVVTAADIAKYYPDHGLLHLVSRRVYTIVPAPTRELISHRAEIRYLRFCLIHVRDNLLRRGFVVNLERLTKFLGEDGLVSPQLQEEQKLPLFANDDPGA